VKRGDTPDSEPPAKSVDRDRRCAQLLCAAQDVFIEKGYHATTVDDITRAAGVAKGTFYLYFNEKRAVFYAVIEQFFERLTEVLRSVSEDVTTFGELVQRVKVAGERLAVFFAENRGLVRLAYRESMGLDERLEQIERDFFRGLATAQAQNVKLAIDLGIVREEVNPLVAAYAHIGMVERLLQQALFDRQFPGVPDLVQQIIEHAFLGLRRPGAPVPAAVAEGRAATDDE